MVFSHNNVISHCYYLQIIKDIYNRKKLQYWRKLRKDYYIIARDRYLNQLIECIGTSKIKIVTGLRRSGKSYLLNTIFTNYLLSIGVDKSHIIFIELDDEKNEYLLEKGKFREYIENIASDDNAQYYIILDEIQLVENFVRTINSLKKHKNRKKSEN